jgi:hypothetical protein
MTRALRSEFENSAGADICPPMIERCNARFRGTDARFAVGYARLDHSYLPNDFTLCMYQTPPWAQS